MVKGVGTSQEFSQTVAKPVIPGPEQSFWFWNPNRIEAGKAPEWFAKQLRDMDQDLEVTWSPVHERWCMWMRNPKLQSKLCQGWSLLFVVQGPNGSYQPLDERVFARLYGASAQRWDSAKTYFDAIEREWERDKAKAESTRNDEVKHSAGEYFDFMKIKNYGKGNKFTNHFS